jgi:hypothetical protein
MKKIWTGIVSTGGQDMASSRNIFRYSLFCFCGKREARWTMDAPVKYWCL